MEACMAASGEMASYVSAEMPAETRGQKGGTLWIRIYSFMKQWWPREEKWVITWLYVCTANLNKTTEYVCSKQCK